MNTFKIYFIILIAISFFACNTYQKKESDVVQTIAPTKDSIIKKPKISKDFILGKFDYKTDTSFVLVDSKYSVKPLYLKNEAYTAFKSMQKAAEQDGITLNILSGTRNFNEQKAIWERKWKRYEHLPPKERALKILEYSSMPSTSRHHWGTDMDLNSLNNSYFALGHGKKIYDWLQKHANSFGFYQVYTEKSNGRTGYNLERWHWSYLPLASEYLNAYNNQISYNDINGFEGSEIAKELDVITTYVNGIALNAKTY
ncbi:MAG: D-alanyl-D-alanine carboxypeptidase family protein [Winogradskyella sp.]|uniref:M15 family metallopeptidase n=1 Tax=Winogradskyella sp. TaxID=1883156 RepID=UPI000F3AC1FB|nr:M15 family metallopeptidase [Winogradskyella sp.]RNC86807.1 MAG: D-alanyl-D-alanine carboxypeptidase family protein [Winogradskyella sp.]